MKNLITTIPQALSIAVLLTASLEASSLKVYNMYDRPWRGMTYPLSNCGLGRQDCAVFPYQSIFNSQPVTFNLPGESIQEFYWKGILGPRYCITVNLEKDERATIELHGDGAYKFNGKMRYAREG